MITTHDRAPGHVGIGSTGARGGSELLIERRETRPHSKNVRVSLHN